MKQQINEVKRMQELAGILIENTISVSDIDFHDDGNRDKIFNIPATDEDIEAFDNDEADLEWEDEEGHFGVYKLPTGEYMYAFPDADYYIKTPKGTVIDFNS